MASDDTSDTDEGSSPEYIEARNRLRWYCVGLLKLGIADGCETADSAGSGTLVKIGKAHFILTAAHVAEALPTKGDVGIVRFSTQEIHLQKLTLDMGYVQPIAIGNSPFSDKGPDLALLPLPEPFVSTVAATNSFFDLGRRSQLASAGKFPSKICFDCLAGVIAERTTDVAVPEDAGFLKRSFEASFEPGTFAPLAEHEGYDLLRFTPQEDEGYEPPSSYQGVSGAALWRVFCERDIRGKVKVKEPWIWGVAFWQSETVDDGSRTITCHGPKSIYERLVQAVCSQEKSS